MDASKLGANVSVKSWIAAGLGAAGAITSPVFGQANDLYVKGDTTVCTISSETPGPNRVSLLDLRANERARQEKALRDKVAARDRQVVKSRPDVVREVLALDLPHLLRSGPVKDPTQRRELEAMRLRLRERKVELGRLPPLRLIEKRTDDPRFILRSLEPKHPLSIAVVLENLGPRGKIHPRIEKVDRGPSLESHLQRAGYYKDKKGVWKQRDTPLEKLGKIFAVHFLESLVDAILFPLWPEHEVKNDNGVVTGKEVNRSYRWTQKGLELLGYAWLAKHVGVEPTIAALIDHLGFVQDWMFYGHHWWMKKAGLVDALVPADRRDRFDTEGLLPNMSKIYDGWWSWTLPLGDEHLKAKLGDGRVYGNMLVETSSRALNLSWALLQLESTPLGDRDLSFGVKKKSVLYHPAHGLEWLINGFAKLAPF